MWIKMSLFVLILYFFLLFTEQKVIHIARWFMSG